MLYETTTTLDATEVLVHVETFFAGEYGLDMLTRSGREIAFQGGGGHVVARIVREHPTTLELETREWDAAVRSFLAQLPR